MEDDNSCRFCVYGGRAEMCTLQGNKSHSLHVVERKVYVAGSSWYIAYAVFWCHDYRNDQLNVNPSISLAPSLVVS